MVLHLPPATLQCSSCMCLPCNQACASSMVVGWGHTCLASLHITFHCFQLLRWGCSVASPWGQQCHVAIQCCCFCLKVCAFATSCSNQGTAWVLVIQIYPFLLTQSCKRYGLPMHTRLTGFSARFRDAIAKSPHSCIVQYVCWAYLLYKTTADWTSRLQTNRVCATVREIVHATLRDV